MSTRARIMRTERRIGRSPEGARAGTVSNGVSFLLHQFHLLQYTLPGGSVPRLTPDEFAELQKIDSPTVSNAIERLEVRPRLEGFAGWDLRCVFPELGTTM